jgi:hypothetical protein
MTQRWTERAVSADDAVADVLSGMLHGVRRGELRKELAGVRRFMV